MNGRVSKKIRKGIEKATEVNVYKTYVGLLTSLRQLPLRKRIKFGFCLVFKVRYK